MHRGWQISLTKLKSQWRRIPMGLVVTAALMPLMPHCLPHRLIMPMTPPICTRLEVPLSQLQGQLMLPKAWQQLKSC